MAVKLTKRQKILYDEIIQYKRDNDGCSPSLLTLRDIIFEKHGIRVTGQTVGTYLATMGDLLCRDELGRLHVRGGKWDMAELQEIVVV